MNAIMALSRFSKALVALVVERANTLVGARPSTASVSRVGVAAAKHPSNGPAVARSAASGVDQSGLTVFLWSGGRNCTSARRTGQRYKAAGCFDRRNCLTCTIPREQGRTKSVFSNNAKAFRPRTDLFCGTGDELRRFGKQTGAAQIISMSLVRRPSWSSCAKWAKAR